MLSGGAGGGKSNRRRFYSRRIKSRTAVAGVVASATSIGKSANQADFAKNKAQVSGSQGIVENQEERTNKAHASSRRLHRSKKTKKQKTPEMEQGEKSVDKGTLKLTSAKNDEHFNDGATIESVSDTKTWFLDLSVEDKAKSAAIFDKAFIGMFLELAGALSIPTNGEFSSFRLFAILARKLIMLYLEQRKPEYHCTCVYQ